MAGEAPVSQVAAAGSWPPRLVGAIRSAAVRRPFLATVLLWALLFLPFAGTRSLYYEEGRYTLAALDMLANGHWLRPQVLGLEYVNKPPLLLWLIASVSWLAGGASEWVVRAPALLATLAGAILIQRTALRAAGPGAGFFAVCAFLFSPFIFTKGARAETDLFVAVTSFAAFTLWLETRRSVARTMVMGWVAATLLLVAAALFKGPPAIAYFCAGAGLVALTERRWRELSTAMFMTAIALASVTLWAALIYHPGDALTWRAQMRAAGWPPLTVYLNGIVKFIGETAAELLPWLVLAGAALSPAFQRRFGLNGAAARQLGLYSIGWTAPLMLWPNAIARYAMPALPAVAVLAGLAGAALFRAGPIRWRRGLAALLVVAIATRLVWVAAIPFETARNEATRRLAAELTAPLAGSNDPLLMLGPAIDYNVAFYMQQAGYAPRQIRTASEISAPAWLISAGAPPTGAREVATAADRKGLVYHLYRVEAAD